MKGQRLSLDMISSLPPNIIESILCLVPIQEAGRTSILSKEWRYKWTKIPKLKFYEHKFKISNDETPTLDITSEKEYLNKKIKFLYAIKQVLLLHQGPINKFTLGMNANGTCGEIDHIICDLSRHNTLEKISLGFNAEYKLPLSIFALHQLTQLKLRRCLLNHEPTFNGFGNLTSLYLDDVNISTKTLLHLLSNCPLLKNLCLFLDGANFLDDDILTLTELFECLPMIEDMFALRWTFECFAENGVPRVLPTTLVHLKRFGLVDFSLIDEYGLPFLGLVLRSSPNLEKLELVILHEDDKSEMFKLEDFSDIWLEHLNELKIKYFGKLKNELEFVKLILAKSPVMKKLHLLLAGDVSKDEEILILRLLLGAPRAAPYVQIIVEYSQ